MNGLLLAGIPTVLLLLMGFAYLIRAANADIDRILLTPEERDNSDFGWRTMEGARESAYLSTFLKEESIAEAERTRNNVKIVEDEEVTTIAA